MVNAIGPQPILGFPTLPMSMGAAPMPVDPVAAAVSQTNQMAMDGQRVAAALQGQGNLASTNHLLDMSTLKGMEQQYLAAIQSPRSTSAPATGSIGTTGGLTGPSGVRTPTPSAPSTTQETTGDKIAAEAQRLFDKKESSAAGPGGGNLACAWIASKILDKTGHIIPDQYRNQVGNLTGYLKSELNAVEIKDPKDVKAGDIVYTLGAGGNHIGIAIGDGEKASVVSNSSSRSAFVWESGLEFDGFYSKRNPGQETLVLRVP
jgi:hypothetical protein